MEHNLINQLVRLLCKAGGETFVGNFQKDGCITDPKEVWNEAEMNEAANYVAYINELFGREEAKSIIISLMSKYHVTADELTALSKQELTNAVKV